MASAPKRIYWDACAWIGYINAETEKITALRAIWEAAKRGKYQIWTSTFSYLEVIHGINEYGTPYPPKEHDDLVYDLLGRVVNSRRRGAAALTVVRRPMN